MEVPNGVFRPVGRSTHAADFGVGDDFDPRVDHFVPVYEVENEIGLLACGEGVAVVSYAGGRCQLRQHARFVEEHLVVARAGIFGLLLERHTGTRIGVSVGIRANERANEIGGIHRVDRVDSAIMRI